jgi:IS30 family transposase
MAKKFKLDPDIQKIIDRAARHDMTPLDLCRAHGMHHSIMYRWINGETSPTLKSLRELQSFLDKLDAKAKAKRAKVAA